MLSCPFNASYAIPAARTVHVFLWETACQRDATSRAVQRGARCKMDDKHARQRSTQDTHKMGRQAHITNGKICTDGKICQKGGDVHKMGRWEAMHNTCACACTCGKLYDAQRGRCARHGKVCTENGQAQLRAPEAGGPLRRARGY